MSALAWHGPYQHIKLKENDIHVQGLLLQTYGQLQTDVAGSVALQPKNNEVEFCLDSDPLQPPVFRHHTQHQDRLLDIILERLKYKLSLIYFPVWQP